MVLVVGGAGYIGSHVIKMLRERAIPHLVFDNLERGHRSAVQSSPLFEGDLRSREDLSRVFTENPEIDTVMHFAAYIEVGESVQDPSKFYFNNVYGVLLLLEAMRDHGVGQFVFSSTAAVYGEPQEVPIPETHPKSPTNPYGDTKLAVERMLAAFDRAYGLRSVCLRYFNAAGSDPDGVLGEDHRPETHLIPRILLAASGKAPQITVFGTDYDTPDGTCLRDYVHVMDLADAHLRAIDHLRSGKPSDQFNLGSGNGYSVKEMIAAAEAVVGEQIPVAFGPRREGDPARLIASSAKAREGLGWQPQWTDMKDIVGHAWAWMSANPDGYPD